MKIQMIDNNCFSSKIMQLLNVFLKYIPNHNCLILFVFKSFRHVLEHKDHVGTPEHTGVQLYSHTAPS